MKIKSQNYLTIQGWMRTELGLTGNELLVYATIYSFSQTEDQAFTGSIQYLADWCGATRQGIIKNLKSLISRELICKEEPERGNETASYRVTELTHSVNIVDAECKHSLRINADECKHSLHNNIVNTDTKGYTKEKRTMAVTKKSLLPGNESKSHTINHIYELYKELCPNLPKVKALNEKRKTVIFNAYKKYGMEGIKEAFIKANNSEFLCGNNDRGWRPDIEWILGEKMINILEGKYDSHKSSSNIQRGKAWEENVRSVAMTKEEREAEEREADRLEAMGIKARF